MEEWGASETVAQALKYIATATLQYYCNIFFIIVTVLYSSIIIATFLYHFCNIVRVVS